MLFRSGGTLGVVQIQERPIGNYRIWISFLKTCLAFHKACQYLELLLLSLIYIQISFGSFLQDGDQGDDDLDDDGPREADLEGRVEKYIGVKVKACIFLCETWKGQG